MVVSTGIRLDGVFRVALLDAERCPDYASAATALCRQSSAVLTVVEAHNMIVTTGLNALAAALAYDFTWGASGFPFTSSQANLSTCYVAVGTGSTAPALGNTQLVAEVARQTLTNAAVSGAQGIYDSFFPTSSGNATIAEVGMFLNATSSANNGTLFDRSVLGATITKASSNTMIAELSLTLSN